MPPYRTFAQKLRDGHRHKHEDHITWTVLVDDLDGRVHRQYGGLTDPCYLIGSDGSVAFYDYWLHAPTMHRAISRLIAMGGRGVVGEDRLPHLLAAMTDGWRGLRRGLPQSFIELETAMPGFASGPWLGYKLKPLLAPVALRATPWPAGARYGLAVLAAAAAVGGLTWRNRRLRAHRDGSDRRRDVLSRLGP